MMNAPMQTQEHVSETRGGIPVSQQQAAVVDHVLSHKVTVVSAGAGSGKTHTTVAALLELLDQNVVTLDQCILITFTNKAADELRARIEKDLIQKKSQATTIRERQRCNTQLERLGAAFIGTIHSFGSWIIKQYGYNQAVPRKAEVTLASMLLLDAQHDAMEQHIKNTTDVKERLFGASPESLRDYEIQGILDSILKHIQNHGISPNELLTWTEQQPDDDGNKSKRVAMAQLVVQAHLNYQEAKQTNNRLDTHDLLIRTAQLLEDSSPDVPERIAQRYNYLFIDEFQDTDHTQKKIVDALIPYLKGTLVVGDNKQSIYAFRGANVTLLHRLAQENIVRVLPLNISRRPTRPFLETQNTLFASIGQRFPELYAPLEPFAKTHEPTKGPPPLLYVSAGENADSTAQIRKTGEVILQQLLDQPIHLDEDGVQTVQPGHIVLLFRSNFWVHKYAEVLKAMGLPISIDTGESFYKQPEIVSTYRLLRLLLHYPDDAVLSLALQTPYMRNVELSDVEQKKIQYGMEDLPLVDELESSYPIIHKHLTELRQRVRTDTVSQIMGRLYEVFQIKEYYQQRGAFSAVQNLSRLRERARSLFQEEQALTLREFVNWLQHAISSDREEPTAELSVLKDQLPSTIRLMTIHRSKGLEFPIVVIPEVQKDIKQEATPPPFIVTESLGLEVNLRSPRESSAKDTYSSRFYEERKAQQKLLVKEEMRILYVALTRAQFSVILVGRGRIHPRPMTTSKYYAWLDEILLAKQSLLSLPYGIAYQF